MNNFKTAADIIARCFLVYIVLFGFFIQMAELLVLVFYVRGCSDNVRAFHTFCQKVRNQEMCLLCSVFPKFRPNLAFSSTLIESRFTCTVLRPFVIVAIRAARM